MDESRRCDDGAGLGREELGRLWEELVGSLRAFFRRRLPAEVSIEDTLQECFVRVLDRAGELRDEDSFAAWVFRIARNLVSDAYRARGAAEGTLEDVESAGVPGVAGVAGVAGDGEPDLTRTVAGWLGPVIDGLPPEQRDIVRAFELEGASQREIAERHGLTVPAVKARVRRGRREIRDRLLGCCAIEFDRVGRVLDYTRRERGACGPDC